MRQKTLTPLYEPKPPNNVAGAQLMDGMPQAHSYQSLKIDFLKENQKENGAKRYLDCRLWWLSPLFLGKGTLKIPMCLAEPEIFLDCFHAQKQTTFLPALSKLQGGGAPQI